MPQLSLHAPFGPITLSEDAGAIVSLDWGWVRDQEETALLTRARDMLELYFDGQDVSFSLPLRPAGTAYQQCVWTALRQIPFGEITTYGSLASRIGGSARSVGGAVRTNPIPILIPCHRVVASNHLGGYSGGNSVEDKAFLLKLEGVALNNAIKARG